MSRPDDETLDLDGDEVEEVTAVTLLYGEAHRRIGESRRKLDSLVEKIAELEEEVTNGNGGKSTSDG